MPKKRDDALYDQIIEKIFFEHYKEEVPEFYFSRTEIEDTAKELGVKNPKNLGDVVYTYRFRKSLPTRITETVREGKYWIIRLSGRGKYKFVLVANPVIAPSEILTVTKIPDATPGIIDKYAFNDEQALLAKLRYNRLIDIFTGLACYSLQNHLRTYVHAIGQIETDELYIGIDNRGIHYVIPVQAKGGSDKLSVVQVEQDFALCLEKFPGLICRPIASQFMADDLIALFELEDTSEGIKVTTEKHYRLVPPEDISPEELASYKNRL